MEKEIQLKGKEIDKDKAKKMIDLSDKITVDKEGKIILSISEDTKKAIEWLDIVTDQAISEMIDEMPLEEVNKELSDIEPNIEKDIETEKFLTKIKDTINSFEKSKKTSKQPKKSKKEE